MSEETSEVERLEGSVVRELCLDYAQFTRVNISEEHGQVSLTSYGTLGPQDPGVFDLKRKLELAQMSEILFNKYGR